MNEISYRVPFFGDVGVGKTSLINRISNNSFSTSVVSTIGVNETKFELNYNNTNYQITFIDTPGQLNFSNIMPNYFRNISFAIIVFDLSNFESLESIEPWYVKFRESNKECEVLILGNKSDMKKNDDKKIEEKVKSLNLDFNINYLDVSAKDGSNISDVLSCIGEMVNNYSFSKPILQEEEEDRCCRK